MKKLLLSLLMFTPLAIAGGQGMYVRINSYLPNVEAKVLNSQCLDHVNTIKVNRTAYIEAGLCLDNDLTISLREKGKEIRQYHIRVSFGGSTLNPRGVHFQGDKVIAATLYPHSGISGTQDWVVISLAHSESDWMKEKSKTISKKPLNAVLLPGSHGDLKITNILIDKQELPTFIDLDGAAEHTSWSGLWKGFKKDRRRFLRNFDSNPTLREKFEEEFNK